jgi:hypothetical protein
MMSREDEALCIMGLPPRYDSAQTRTEVQV